MNSIAHLICDDCQEVLVSLLVLVVFTIDCQCLFQAFCLLLHGLCHEKEHLVRQIFVKDHAQEIRLVVVGIHLRAEHIRWVPQGLVKRLGGLCCFWHNVSFFVFLNVILLVLIANHVCFHFRDDLIWNLRNRKLVNGVLTWVENT